jgi:predicted Zn-dependent protease
VNRVITWKTESIDVKTDKKVNVAYFTVVRDYDKPFITYDQYQEIDRMLNEYFNKVVNNG